MIYLIGQLAGWLLLTGAFAALAGWAYAAHLANDEETASRRERDHLVRDLVALAHGESGAANDGLESEREIDAARRMNEIQISRIAELERALSAARSNADSAASQLAALQRDLESRDQAEAALVVEPEGASTDQDAVALQAWRLRYFEQRVRYLENGARQPALPAAADAPTSAPLLDAWRARVAEAEAAHLAGELRAISAGPKPERTDEPSASPFAENADVDVLLRWRMLYLERRVAHLQREAAASADAAALAPLAEVRPDPDIWKWRARYLEARARHLEQRVAPPPQEAPPELAEPALAPTPSAPRAKPYVLAAARNGAPDDFTLIEEVSPLLQTTLYSIGIFHFDQIAQWTPENVAWVDHYLRLRGRIDAEHWVEQAQELAREGPAAARRAYEAEEA